MVRDCFHMWGLLSGNVHDLEHAKIRLVILVQMLEWVVIADAVEGR